MRLYNLYCLFFLCCFQVSQAQVRGVVTDPSGQPLPFATIYLQGTSRGTTTNVEGSYFLELEQGSHQLVFQYVGYQQKIVAVETGSTTNELNVVLRPQAVDLGMVEIRADAEDPAYAIIRKAIAKRKYYKDQIDAFSCQVYIKGLIKILSAPEKMMGQEIGDMGGALDTTGQGILYFSESESILHFQQPDKVKEIMISSKVSGDDSAFGFNNAADMDFDLYDNYSNYGRQILSPIADNALSYYNYRLVSSNYDEEGRLINKIELLPKRPEDPVFRGFIYIVEDLWNIQSVDAFLLGSAINQPFIDTIHIQQVHVPVREPDAWRIFSQSYDFRGSALGFTFGGQFTGIYSNYDLNPGFAKKFFDNEVFKVEEAANEKGLRYFDTIRPIPLTVEEVIDYNRKDSLQTVRRSKPFLDSLDAKNNKFTLPNLFLGYSFDRSYERWSLSVGSPITTLQFNPVQGWNMNLDLSYRKSFDENNARWIRAGSELSYGFSEKRFRNALRFTANFNRTRSTRLDLEGGAKVVQFNAEAPIDPSTNSMYSSYFHRNYMKLYDKSFGEIRFRHELWNGVLLQLKGNMAKRSPLLNQSEYSFFYQDTRLYTANDPQDPLNYAPSFAAHQAFQVDVRLRIQINQKYLSYPDRKFNLNSDWPELWIHYRKGIPWGGPDENLFSAVDYDYLSLEVKKDYIPLGLVGFFDFFLQAGFFPQADRVYFMDYAHFNGNQTVLGNPLAYQDHFLLLPYYDYSTLEPHAQAHWQHHFDGFLLDKIPGIRKLGLTTVVSYKHLYVLEQGHYSEVSFAFDQLGLGLFRLFRLDLAAAFDNGKFVRFSPVIGIKFPAN